MKPLLTIFMFILAFSSAFTQAYEINNFDVSIEITESGKMKVQEVISVNFNEERRGIFRNIPFRYKLNGKKYNINISDISVTGHSQKVTNEGANKNIRIGDPDIYLTGKQTYEINYTVDKAILQYEDGQEIYWNITGHEWDTKIQNASFEILLPKNIENHANPLMDLLG